MRAHAQCASCMTVLLWQYITKVAEYLSDKSSRSGVHVWRSKVRSHDHESAPKRCCETAFERTLVELPSLFSAKDLNLLVRLSILYAAQADFVQ